MALSGIPEQMTQGIAVTLKLVYSEESVFCWEMRFERDTWLMHPASEDGPTLLPRNSIAYLPVGQLRAFEVAQDLADAAGDELAVADYNDVLDDYEAEQARAPF